MRRFVAIALWFAGNLVPIEATTLARASLDDLIQKSTAIVRGRVVGSHCNFNGSLISTNVRVEVLERWKGPLGAYEEVMIPGGLTQGFRQNIAGVPELRQGTEYVFFLWTGRNRVTHLLGLSQGVLDLARNGQGEVTVGRSATDAVLIDPKTGRMVKDEPFTMRLSEFTLRITRTLGGGRSR